MKTRPSFLTIEEGVITTTRQYFDESGRITKTPLFGEADRNLFGETCRVLCEEVVWSTIRRKVELDCLCARAFDFDELTPFGIVLDRAETLGFNRLNLEQIFLSHLAYGTQPYGDELCAGMDERRDSDRGHYSRFWRLGHGKGGFYLKSDFALPEGRKIKPGDVFLLARSTPVVAG